MQFGKAQKSDTEKARQAELKHMYYAEGGPSFEECSLMVQENTPSAFRNSTLAWAKLYPKFYNYWYLPYKLQDTNFSTSETNPELIVRDVLFKLIECAYPDTFQTVPLYERAKPMYQPILVLLMSIPEFVTLVETHRADPLIQIVYNIYCLAKREPGAPVVTVLDLFTSTHFQQYFASLIQHGIL
jgi:hypothetical protein